MNISRAKDILDYWFSKGLYTADYNKWFTKSQDYDEEITEKFGDLLKEAEQGKGFSWLHTKDSYLAHIILLDQFSRHIYRGSGDSFKNDNGALLFTDLGFHLYKKELVGYEFMFALMPYMHTEKLGYQKKGQMFFELHKSLYGKACCASVERPLTAPIHVSYMGSLDEVTNYDKEYAMLKSMEPHVVGHKQTIQMFGRFPKRNVALGRETTIQEEQYLNREEVKKRPY
jgi:uncharacterized protein (DUF924 family)